VTTKTSYFSFNSVFSRSIITSPSGKKEVSFYMRKVIIALKNILSILVAICEIIEVFL